MKATEPRRRRRTPAKTYPPGWFSEPVRLWMPWFVPSDHSDFSSRISQAVTEARERDMKSDDPWTAARARGDVGMLASSLPPRFSAPLKKDRRTA